jgi:hypothetical protein
MLLDGDRSTSFSPLARGAGECDENFQHRSTAYKQIMGATSRYDEKDLECVQSLLCSVSGLRPVPVEAVHNYQPKSKYVSAELPSAVSNRSILDLTLLKGICTTLA